MAKFDTTSAPSLDKARELGESCDGVLFHDRNEDEVNASRIAKMGKRLLELDGEVENGGENGAFRHRNSGRLLIESLMLGGQSYNCGVAR